jgi:hypothetical protein
VAFLRAEGPLLEPSDPRVQINVEPPGDPGETLRRSTAQAGQTALVIGPGDPAHVYVGNGSVLEFVNQ